MQQWAVRDGAQRLIIEINQPFLHSMICFVKCNLLQRHPLAKNLLEYFMGFPLLESYYHSKINFIEKYDFGRINLSFEIEEHTISIGR